MRLWSTSVLVARELLVSVIFLQEVIYGLSILLVELSVLLNSLMVSRALTNVEEGLLSVGVGWTVVAREVGVAGVGCASRGVCMVSFVERLGFG